MLQIDPVRWLAAVEATQWHRSQVQTFLYPAGGIDPAENGWRAGAHVARDCTLDWDKQVIFRQVDLTGEKYDEITAQAKEVADLYETTIVINRYNKLEEAET
jgi:hypothetical protein